MARENGKSIGIGGGIIVCSIIMHGAASAAAYRSMKASA